MVIGLAVALGLFVAFVIQFFIIANRADLEAWAPVLCRSRDGPSLAASLSGPS
jgi:hypothetical protein